MIIDGFYLHGIIDVDKLASLLASEMKWRQLACLRNYMAPTKKTEMNKQKKKK